MTGLQAERSGMDLGGVPTGVTDQYGVVWDDSISVQRWAELNVS